MSKLAPLITPTVGESPQIQVIPFLMNDNDGNEVLKLCENGDFFVKGKLAESDKEIVDTFREYFKNKGYLK